MFAALVGRRLDLEARLIGGGGGGGTSKRIGADFLCVPTAGGGNFTVPVPGSSATSEEDPAVAVEDDLSRQIVQAESSNEWTLMHRFKKAADLLEGALRVRRSRS